MLHLPRPTWVLIGCALLLGACGGAKGRYHDHLQRAAHYLDAGNLDKAGVELRNALQIEPRSAEALYLYGQVAERQGRLREALGSYQAAIDTDADSVRARAALGRLLVLAGAAERALTVVAPGLARHPEEPRLLIVRGAARAQQRDLAGAAADAEHAARIAADDEDALALLASVYQSRGETARATELLEAAVGRQPKSVALRQVLASLYLTGGERARCESELKQIVALAPAKFPYRAQLAAFYARAGDADAAQQVLEDAVKAAPADNGAKLALVDFLSHERSRAQGEQVLRGFIAHEPDNDELRIALGTLLQRAGAPAEAAAAYGEIVSRDPAATAALTARDRMAAIDLSRGQVEEAQQLIKAVLERNPQDADALIMRGGIALAHEDPAAAIADLRTVLRDQPNAPGVERSLARAYLANGEPALAEETLRAAAQAAPADRDTQVELAQLLLQTGRGEAAAALLEDAVQRAPGDPGLEEALIRVYLARSDFARARTAADHLKTLAPGAASGPYLAGLTAVAQGHFEEAQRELEQALKDQPGSIDTLSALTHLELRRGQNAAAVARARAFAQAHPEDAPALNLLGEVLTATRAYAEAGTTLEHAVRVAPRWPLPYHNLAAARLAAGDEAGARAAYQAGLQQLPREPLLVTALADLEERAGRVDQAIALYEDLNAHRPHLELAANNLAMLLVTYRSDQRSLDRARELTSSFAGSQNSALLDTLGWVRLKTGDLAAALPSLERAADQAPRSSVIHYHLAMAELRAGQRDKARANLESALAGGTNFAGSGEARTTLNNLNSAGKG